MKYFVRLFARFVLCTTACAQPLVFSTTDIAPRLHDNRDFTLADGQTIRLKGLFNAESGDPVEVSGGFRGETVSNGDLLGFIDSHPAYFHVSRHNLEILNSGAHGGKQFLTARQKIDGRSVLGTHIILRAGRSGKVILWGADVIKEAPPLWSASVTEEMAAEAIRQALNVSSVRVVERQEIWMRRADQIIPAYALKLVETGGWRQLQGIVDAESGTVLSAGDGMQHVTITGALSGPVLPLNPLTPEETWPLSKAFVHVASNPNFADTTDEAGMFEIVDLEAGNHELRFGLDGPYISVQDHQLSMMENPDAIDDPYLFDSLCTAPGDVSFQLDPNEMDVTLAAVNCFAHLNILREWWYERDPEIEIIQEALRIFPDQTDPFFLDNAGFMPATPPFLTRPFLMFGAGGTGHNNFAWLAEIVYHEYNHGVTNQYYPGSGQPTNMVQAMHEGFSDYFACTITGIPDVGRGFVIANPDSCLRTLVNDLVYPGDYESNSHHDGQILSGAMWEARATLGAEIVDTLFHLARYAGPDDFDAYYLEVLLWDDDNDDLEDGTPHQTELHAAFHNHGIGPDDPDPVGRDPVDGEIADTPSLNGLYPNPFNLSTTVDYTLPRASDVVFILHDVLGREVHRVTMERQAAGAHNLSLNFVDAASGIYFLRMEAGEHVQLAKAVLLK